MSENYFPTVDAGTGSIRAILFDLAGNRTSCAWQEWDRREDPKYPGSMDFDWGYNWKLTCGCIRDVLEQSDISPADIAAISTIYMGESIVFYDRDEHETWAYANVGAGSTDEVSQLKKAYPGLKQELYMESGQIYTLNALLRLLWVRDRIPGVYEKVAHVGMFNDWLIHKTAGILAMESSNGPTTGLFSLKKRSWDPSIARRCRLHTGMSPEIKECGSRVGAMTAQYGEQTGLAQGIPVIVGDGDTQLGCIGVGVVRSNQAAVFGGNFRQYGCNTADGRTDKGCRVRVNCHTVPDVWQYETLALKPGLMTR